MADQSFTRRDILRLAAATTAGVALPFANANSAPRTLRAGVARVDVVGAPHPATEVWSYDGDVPGPVLRYRQGDHLRIDVENRLPDPTTVHWHGIRVPNAMDGVPHLTQPPIKPGGGRFAYEFPLHDAGTFWYHPHLGNPEQVGRGLYGALIVDEAKPPAVDREIVWTLGDWRLDAEARIVGDFRNFMDASHAGRIGNTVTVNGRIPDSFELRSGERVRLRLANVANARIFALDFRGHEPIVIALDGHPVEPHPAPRGRVVLGPGMRADVLLDAIGKPGSASMIVDDFYPGRAYRLLDLRYATRRMPGLAKAPLSKFAANPLSEPRLARAERHQLRFEGGMMGNMRMDSMPMRRKAAVRVWTINGKAVTGDDHVHEPLLTLAYRHSHVIEVVNDTAWHHPIHLHGHVFRVLTRDGRPTAHREWQDTILLDPRSRAEIALVADNPGDWMLHCHVLEHQASGMMAVVRVA